MVVIKLTVEARADIGEFCKAMFDRCAGKIGGRVSFSDMISAVAIVDGVPDFGAAWGLTPFDCIVTKKNEAATAAAVQIAEFSAARMVTSDMLLRYVVLEALVRRICTDVVAGCATAKQVISGVVTSDGTNVVTIPVFTQETNSDSWPADLSLDFEAVARVCAMIAAHCPGADVYTSVSMVST
jgi:hypothetical protein